MQLTDLLGVPDRFEFEHTGRFALKCGDVEHDNRHY
jgi:hypothetical protein